MLTSLFSLTTKKTFTFCMTVPFVIGAFPSQRTSNAEIVSMLRLLHVFTMSKRGNFYFIISEENDYLVPIIQNSKFVIPRILG